MVELVLFATRYNTVLCDRDSCRCSNSCKVLKKCCNLCNTKPQTEDTYNRFYCTYPVHEAAPIPRTSQRDCPLHSWKLTINLQTASNATWEFQCFRLQKLNEKPCHYSAGATEWEPGRHGYTV